MKEQSVSSEAIDWAHGILRGLGHATDADVQSVVETAFSCVKKLVCGEAVFYLKKTPPSLFIEADIINFLRDACGVTTIPEIIKQNRTLDCFLMKPCGEESLRTLFARTFDMSLLLQGVENYKAIQKSTERHTVKLMEMGVPDWRLSRLPLMYKEMINDHGFLKRCEISPDHVKRLHELQGAFTGVCEELAAFGIPDCLNHSDFQANNMLVDKDGQKVSVIDWGEVSIGNPLLSLSKCLKTISGRQDFDVKTYSMVEAHFYEDYFTSPSDMSRATAITDQLSYIYYIFTLRKLEELTQQTSEVWNSRMGGAFLAFLGLSSLACAQR